MYLFSINPKPYTAWHALYPDSVGLQPHHTSNNQSLNQVTFDVFGSLQVSQQTVNETNIH